MSGDDEQVYPLQEANVLGLLKLVAGAVGYLHPWSASDVDEVIRKVEFYQDDWRPGVKESAIMLFLLDSANALTDKTATFLHSAVYSDVEGADVRLGRFQETIRMLMANWIAHGDAVIVDEAMDDILGGEAGKSGD